MTVLGWGLIFGGYIAMELLWAMIDRRSPESTVPWYASATLLYFVMAVAGFWLVFGSVGEGLGAAVASLLIALPSVASGKFRGN